MSDADLINLYSGRILELAANIPHLGKLAQDGASIRKRAPLCGSTVAVRLSTKDGKITDFAQDVRACALGQASAAILGGVVLGRSLADLTEARASLAAMLKDGAPAPPPPFQDYELLRPASAYRNRHASILLALDATIEAMDAAQAS